MPNLKLNVNAPGADLTVESQPWGASNMEWNFPLPHWFVGKQGLSCGGHGLDLMGKPNKSELPQTVNQRQPSPPVLSLTLNGTVLNVMLCKRRLKSGEDDHKVIRKEIALVPKVMNAAGAGGNFQSDFFFFSNRVVSCLLRTLCFTFHSRKLRPDLPPLMLLTTEAH